ncbi:MAG: FKBP-type peptidyl-prolyl cis-trans isomerase [Mariniphaga sp.]
MKIKTLLNIALAAFIAVVVSSCLKSEEEEKTYSAAEEKALRDDYLDGLIEQDYDIDTTENGVYYVIIEEGEGEFASPGDSLTVGYAGYFIDGGMFDTSEWHYDDGKMGFVLGRDSMIDGWEEGIQVMNEGTIAEFIIPSELAYGAEGAGAIPPYQTLVFVIKLFDIHPLEETN